MTAAGTPEAWGHDDLASDLVGHLRGYARPMACWENLQLGPSGSIRPDVFTVEHTYTALRCMAFEVKVTRADFLRDVQAGKALGYLKFAGALVFACPRGMVKKAEVPEGCGLIERGPEAWRWSRKPTIQRLDNLPWQAWLKLVMDGCGRESGALRDQRKPREAGPWKRQQLARRLLGDDLARLVANRDRAVMLLEDERAKAAGESDALRLERERRAEDARKWAQAQADEVRACVAQLAVELGLEPDVPHYRVVTALRALRPAADAERLAKAARDLERLAEQARGLAADLRVAPGA